jgi:hypothetical protein
LNILLLQVVQVVGTLKAAVAVRGVLEPAQVFR